ncbi:MAG: hypothetical protein IAE79_17265 [Anaerolinea sp.]|nr:hypothetical protein [Anaerolinea sp.]
MGQTTITLTGPGVQTMRLVDIHIAIEATLNLDATAARRRATAWLVSEVGNMLVGGPPQLVIGKEVVWRVPALLTSSEVGMLGAVGSIDVLAESGIPLVSDELRAQILEQVEQFSRSLPSPDR